MDWIQIARMIALVEAYIKDVKGVRVRIKLKQSFNKIDNTIELLRLKHAHHIAQKYYDERDKSDS